LKDLSIINLNAKKPVAIYLTSYKRSNVKKVSPSRQNMTPPGQSPLRSINVEHKISV